MGMGADGLGRAIWGKFNILPTVIPAQAGIRKGRGPLDSRLRGKDGFYMYAIALIY